MLTKRSQRGLAPKADQRARCNTRWSVTTRVSWLHPLTRKHAVTVRLPVASIAPTTKTCACAHTGLEKSGANPSSRDSNAAGSVSIARPLVVKVVFSLYWLPLRFQSAKMAKVELRYCWRTP